MDLRTKVSGILAKLDEEYGEVKCFLHYETSWQLLFATILSAQCTDDRVNLVTSTLFQKYPTLHEFASADLNQMEQEVRSTGFYHNKAKNIIACAQILLSQYGGQVPEAIECLTALPGVGRKTANVVRGNIYGIKSIVVDTHVKRVSRLLGLTQNASPVKIEFDLMELLPKDHWIRYNTQIISHGRKVCIARRPQCMVCVLSEYCDYHKNGINE